MIPILTLIFVVALSMFLTKAATIALMHTGMSRERARFQARSALSGAGFTTNESELVVKHPVRRRIITLLILIGNAGVVTAISSLILGFVNPESGFAQMRNIYILIFGIALLIFATRWSWLDRYIEKAINILLEKYTDIRPRQFSKILTVMEDYEVTELQVKENAWMEGQTLADLNLPEEGILVLGILKHGQTYLGVPRGRYRIKEDDRLYLYGKAERIQELSTRRDALEGKVEHKEAVDAHQQELEEQDEALQESDHDRKDHHD